MNNESIHFWVNWSKLLQFMIKTENRKLRGGVRGEGGSGPQKAGATFHRLS